MQLLSYHYYPELSGNKCICIHITFDLNVLGGRRGAITLAHILMFATCVDGEPTLGFKVQPSINFTEATGNDNFIPTANTCICSLTLPYGTRVFPLPAPDKLFSLYDYAFVNAFFGNI